MAAPHTHKIWIIDEIVRNILVHLPLTRCESTLANCARVSHALSEPALDMLWCKMSGLVPLFRLLPHSLTKARNEDGDCTTFMLIRAIQDEEWRRFTSYARRVRKFHYHYTEGPGDRLGEKAFAALIHHMAVRGTTLFPNLQEFSSLQFSRVTQCLPFICPSLRRVTVYVQTRPIHARGDAGSHPARSASGSEDLVGLFQLLDARSSCVEELSLDGIDLPLPLASPVVFRHLRTLRLGSVTTPPSVIITHCSKMPRLASLTLTLLLGGSSDRPRPRGVFGSPASTLNTLEVLRIAGTPSEIEAILDAIDSPSFHTAALSISVPDHDPEGWTRCASCLSARFASSLRTLRVECTRSSTLIPSHARPFAQYVQPLLPLRTLRECSIVVDDPAGATMSNGDVETMARSWHGLTALEVSFRGPQAASLPSLGSLAAFARHCKDILTLRLPVNQDVSVIESHTLSDWEVSLPRRFRSELRNLWLAGVRYSRAESQQIARFLRAHFPDVDLQPMMNAGVLCLA